MKITIIGAGVLGLMTAFELLRAGCQVLVLEQGEVGKESSWAGGGIVSPLYPWRYPPAVTALASLAQQAYPQLAKELLDCSGVDIELYPCGMLMLAAEDQRDAMVWAQQYRKPLQYLTGEQLGIHAPFKQGLWLPEVANVRNPRLLQALKLAVLRLGGKIIEQAKIATWQTSAGRISGVQTVEGVLYPVDQLVVTTGAWTGELLAQQGISLPVKPIKGQMLLYKTAVNTLTKIILYRGHYVIPRRDGHILCGSTLEDTGFEKTTTPEAATLLAQIAQELVPELKEALPIKQWAGLRPSSPNGIPFIGRLPRYSNVWLNCGQYRNGLVLAPASARLLADLLLGRPTSIAAEPYQIMEC